MNPNNKYNQFKPEYNNILNDEEYVALINNLSDSIYKYALATKGNFQEIQKIFEVMDDDLKQNKEIINFLNLSESNENNLNLFFSDAKISFKNLKIVRKEYLKNIDNYIKFILLEKKGKTRLKRQNSQGNCNKHNQRGSQTTEGNSPGMIDLLMSLNYYIDIIGFYSQQEKENYLNLLNMIIKEFKKYENILNSEENTESINGMEKEIKNYQKIINKYKESNIKLKNYSMNLEKKIENLSHNKDNIIASMNKVNTQLKQEVRKERYNSTQYEFFFQCYIYYYIFNN